MQDAIYYKLLGVETNATKDEILKAYRGKVKEYHPDRNNDSKLANDMFLHLTEAKDCLIDDARRLEYDYSANVKKRPLETKYAQNNNSISAGMVSCIAIFTLLVGVLIGGLLEKQKG